MSVNYPSLKSDSWRAMACKKGTTADCQSRGGGGGHGSAVGLLTLGEGDTVRSWDFYHSAGKELDHYEGLTTVAPIFSTSNKVFMCKSVLDYLCGPHLK